MPIKPDIHLSYTQKIWSVFTAGDKFLLLELRDESTMSATFDLYKFTEQKYQWQGFSLKEQWRVGVSYCNEEVIILHQYESGTIPAIASLTAIDTETGGVAWVCNDFQPVSYGKDWIKGTLDGQIMYLKLSNGSFTNEIDSYEATDENNGVLQPLTYSEDTANFVTVNDFVQEYFNERAIGSIIYCEYGNNIFVAYHIREGDKYCIKLSAITSSGKIWLNEKIDESEKLMSDIFFIWRNHLVFFKGKNELMAINLKEK